MRTPTGRARALRAVKASHGVGDRVIKGSVLVICDLVAVQIAAMPCMDCFLFCTQWPFHMTKLSITVSMIR